MFDIGWTEMFVIIVVAVIVIGPKDLPRALRTVGQWMGKIRAVGREFQRGIDDLIRETDLEDMKKQLDATRSLDLKKEIENTIDPTGTIKEAMKPVEVPKLDAEKSESPTGPDPKEPPPQDDAPAPVDTAANESVPDADAKTGT